ncbi:hypothetical protein ACIOFZ_31045, partial [Streptomyces nodosus]
MIKPSACNSAKVLVRDWGCWHSANEPVREQLGSAVLFSVMAGASVWLGTQMSPRPVIGAVVFVALMTASVWTRRFGPMATRLGAMVPLALLASLFTTGGAEQVPWWPRCGRAALVGLLAFCWVHVLRRAGQRLLRLPRPEPRAAASRRQRARRGPSVSTRMAAQTGLSLAVAFTAGHLLFGEHWQWTVLSALVVSLGTIGRVRFPRDARSADSRSDKSRERRSDDACPQEIPA